MALLKKGPRRGPSELWSAVLVLEIPHSADCFARRAIAAGRWTGPIWELDRIVGSSRMVGGTTPRQLRFRCRAVNCDARLLIPEAEIANLLPSLFGREKP